MQPKELKDTLINDYWKRLADLTYHDDELIKYEGNLYHYTSSVGLLGILKNQKVWATESSYLNDSQEIKYGIRIATDKLQEIPNTEKWIANLKEKVIARINDFHAKTNVYVACFCENGDLLSQWKGYANFGDGYSIGLKASELLRTKRKFPYFNIAFRKVIYEKSEQENILENEFEEVLLKTNILLKKFPNFQTDIIETTTSYIVNFLNAQIARFKSSVFQEEREWRAIYFDNELQELKEQIQFRVSGSYVIPYVELDIAPSAQKKKWFLPVVDVIVGAKIDHARAKKSIELICTNLSVNPPIIHSSDILLQ